MYLAPGKPQHLDSTRTFSESQNVQSDSCTLRVLKIISKGLHEASFIMVSSGCKAFSTRLCRQCSTSNTKSSTYLSNASPGTIPSDPRRRPKSDLWTSSFLFAPVGCCYAFKGFCLMQVRLINLDSASFSVDGPMRTTLHLLA